MSNDSANQIPTTAGSIESTDDDYSMGLGRRRFLIYISLGLASSLVGGELYCSDIDAHGTKLNMPRSNSSDQIITMKPKLRKGVLEVRKEKFHIFEYRPNPGDAECGCAINETGAAIIRLLDGRHSIEDIAHSTVLTETAFHFKEACAKIAFFVAQLGAIGLLAEPYYVQIYEVYDT